jgi:ubiquitin-conjugating enzyme E2 D/E
VADFHTELENEKKIKNTRLPKEFTDLRENPVNGVTFEHSDEMTCKLLIEGPHGTPYEGGRFEFLIMFGKNYPFEAPVVQCLNRIYHPQVSQQGDVRLGFLNEWAPTCTARQLIESIVTSLVQIDISNSLQASIAFECEHNRP